jgi:hypothetical protein
VYLLLYKHRDVFDKVKHGLRDEWEAHTGQKWPVYDRDYYPEGRRRRRQQELLENLMMLTILSKIVMVGLMNGGIFILLISKTSILKIHGSGAQHERYFTEATPVAPKQGE